jgi:hypothetical protein
MKYIDEFRDGALAHRLATAIAAETEPGRTYHLMEFCGGHTHAISRYGITDLLPPSVRMIHGPGCPVCVLPIGRVDLAIDLALQQRVILATYGDCLRVPASNGLSLLKAKARGGDVRMVYSPADALTLAQAHPEREVVFFAIGFETTTPPTALVIKQAARLGLTNFSVVCNHVLTPAAITNILESPEVRQLGTLPLDDHRQPTLRVLCRGVPQAGSDRGFRAARRDAGHPDAGAPDQPGPRRGRERVHPRRQPRGQSQGAGPGVRGVRAAPHVRVAWAGPGAIQCVAHP